MASSASGSAGPPGPSGGAGGGSRKDRLEGVFSGPRHKRGGKKRASKTQWQASHFFKGVVPAPPERKAVAPDTLLAPELEQQEEPPAKADEEAEPELVELLAPPADEDAQLAQANEVLDEYASTLQM